MVRCGAMFWSTDMIPPGIAMGADGFYTTPDGRRLCEACWTPIRPYVDFPFGLTSPDSDGDAGGNFAKRRQSAVDGKPGVEALRKAVCLPCYLLIFQQVHPGVPLPILDGTIRQTIPPAEPDAPLVSVPEPTVPALQSAEDVEGAWPI